MISVGVCGWIVDDAESSDVTDKTLHQSVSSLRPAINKSVMQPKRLFADE